MKIEDFLKVQVFYNYGQVHLILAGQLIKKLKGEEISDWLEFEEIVDDKKLSRIFFYTENYFAEVGHNSETFNYSLILLNKIVGMDVKLIIRKQIHDQNVEKFVFQIITSDEKMNKIAEITSENLEYNRFVRIHQGVMDFNFNLLSRISENSNKTV